MHLHEFILRDTNNILDRWSADLATRHPAIRHESARTHPRSSSSQSVLVGDVLGFEQGDGDALFEAARHYTAHVYGTRSMLLAIDFSGMELGRGLGVKPQAFDLSPVCAEELDQISAAHAELALQLEVSGDCRARWDSSRVQQMLNNLVDNAAVCLPKFAQAGVRPGSLDAAL